jgi:hypothetical protein
VTVYVAACDIVTLDFTASNPATLRSENHTPFDQSDIRDLIYGEDGYLYLSVVNPATNIGYVYKIDLTPSPIYPSLAIVGTWSENRPVYSLTVGFATGPHGEWQNYLFGSTSPVGSPTSCSVVKIDPITMTTVGEYIFDIFPVGFDEVYPPSIIYDRFAPQDRLFASAAWQQHGVIGNAKLNWEIDADVMLRVNNHCACDGPFHSTINDFWRPRSVDTDGTNVYVTGRPFGVLPASVIKYDPTTAPWTVLATWLEAPFPGDFPTCLILAGDGNLYMGGVTGRTSQVNPATMATIASCVIGIGEIDDISLAPNPGSKLYVCQSNAGLSGAVYEIDPTTMTWTTNFWQRLAHSNFYRGIAAPGAGGSEVFQAFTEAFPVNAPTVTTLPATAVSPLQATLNGVLNDDGGEGCSCRFRYGTDPTLSTYMTSPLVSGFNTGDSISAIVLALSPNTTYYFQAEATNDAGTAVGSILSFTTLTLNLLLSEENQP